MKRERGRQISCGIDEAGYGPRLGPLVICASWCRAKSPPRDCPVRVADSKKMYSPARGIGLLERTALGFAGQMLPLEGLTYGRLRREAAGPLPELPWYGDAELPWSASSVPVDEVRGWLGRREFGFSARVVEPEKINDCANKATLLFSEAAAVMRGLLERFRREPVVFRIGKHGGRRFYAGLILQEFGAAPLVECETPGRSTYRLRLGGREVVFDFLRDGEDRDFFLALASVFAKYLREGSMRLFNRFWRSRIPELRPTSGYGDDGMRFFRAIEPELRRLDLSPGLVLRSR